jgi:hypothetical protein
VRLFDPTRLLSLMSGLPRCEERISSRRAQIVTPHCQIFTFDKEICVCLNAATEAWIEPQVSFCQAQANHAVDGFEVSGDLGGKVVSKWLMRGQAPFLVQQLFNFKQ